MEKEKYFKMIEEVLDTFPPEYGKNYYENKNRLIVNKVESMTKNITGNYNHEKNIITLYSEESFIHELFHMSFRNSEKVGMKLYENTDLYYSNGVSIERYNNNQKQYFNSGLTEGFTEYLSRKCMDSTGQQFNYFFVDLLISIYGEDILKYPLNNDPKGILLDERFNDIYEFAKTLDKLDDAIDSMMLMVNFKNVFMSNKNDGVQDALIIIENINKHVNESIVECFRLIISEYENCLNPNINKEDFINKMELFLFNPNYNLILALDNEKYNSKEKITALIDKFKKTKPKNEQIFIDIQKIKNKVVK